MKKELYIPVFGLIAGEFTIFFGNIFYGLGIHVVNLLVTTLIIIFEQSLEMRMKNILRYIILIVLLRMINISTPLLFSVVYLQYLLMFIAMLIPIYYIMKDKLVLYKESRIDPIRFYIPLVTTLLIELVIVISQYVALNPIPLDVIYESGKYTTIYMIISIVITLLLSDTRYWNKYASDTLDMSSNSLFPIFMVITIHKIVSII